MLRTLFFVLCISVVALSCLKSADNKSCAYSGSNIIAPQSEQDSIVAYLDSNNLEAVRHSSGMYYQILNEGTGSDTMTLCSEVLVDYKGKFKNDQQFDEGTNVYFVLGGPLIQGWKKGIPLIRKGGQIRLYIPPTLGYGDRDLVNEQTGAVIIPGKSMLIFDVKLKDYTKGY